MNIIYVALWKESPVSIYPLIAAVLAPSQQEAQDRIQNFLNDPLQKRMVTSQVLAELYDNHRHVMVLSFKMFQTLKNEGHLKFYSETLKHGLIAVLALETNNDLIKSIYLKLIEHEMRFG